MIYLVFIVSLLVNISLLYYELGLGVLVSVLFQLTIIGYSLAKKNKLDLQWGIKLFITLLLIAPFILRDMLVFKVLTLLALPFIYSLFFIDFKSLQLLKYISLILDVTFRPFAKFHLFFKELGDKVFKGREEVKYIITGIIITIPFLIIILPLLISSDLILESMTIDFFDSLQLSSELIFRIVFILIFCSYWYGQFNYDQKHLLTKELIPRVRAKQSVFVTYTFLTIINLIYGLYVFIQVKYLFLSSGNLPDGITYAEYAREGFFQLVVITLINLGLIIIVELFNHTGLLKQRLLESLTLLSTIVMAISAFYRMSLYEQSYGYTTLRLLVFIFLIILIIVMTLLVFYIVSYKKLLLSSISLFVIIAYISVSWINLDSYVAKANIERFEETDEIDTYYLNSLSLDAKLEQEYFEKNYPDYIDQNSYEYARDDFNQNNNIDIDQGIKWQEWNIQK